MLKKIFGFKYPKLSLLIISIILAYLFFRTFPVQNYFYNLGNLSYIGIFIAGILFAFGFTAPFAVGFFIGLNPPNLLLAGIIGGTGALAADVFIFHAIKVSFNDEFNRLKKTYLFVRAKNTFNKLPFEKIKLYLMYAFAGILIASPLPDELGITLLAGLTQIKARVLALLSFILNTFGILVLLAL